MRTALITLYRHAGRSLLTILGILVGVSAIVITFSIGRGTEEKIKKQIMWMGEGACYIIAGNVSSHGATAAMFSKPVRLTIGDLEAIKGQVPFIEQISRSTYTLELLEHKGAATRDRVLGTDANIFKINKNKLRYGTGFTEQHIRDRVNVVVLGAKVAEKLFGTRIPVGEIITMNGNPFQVIGVIEHQDNFNIPEDINTRSYVPFTVAKKYFSAAHESEDDLNAIAISFYEGVSSEQPLRIIKRILRFRHHIEDDEEDDFTIFDQETIAGVASEAGRIIKLFGLIAASISLLVGGIGVMNIMLVSVKERTQEIGLRMALGARRRLIQAQFLIESILVSGIGGLIGLLLGLLGQVFIGRYTGLTMIIEYMPFLVSFIATVAVGIFFGYYPARVASLMHPIDALLER